MDAETFLRDYWQKAPADPPGDSLMRSAGGFCLAVSELASRDDVESRLIESPARPLESRARPAVGALAGLAAGQRLDHSGASVNHHLPHIADILWRFDFLPYARLDDLMISYAPPGGTGGPAF